MRKSFNLVFSFVVLIGIALIGGCGGGGGGGGSHSTPVALKFRTYSTSVPNGISDVGFRLELPAGVTVATDPLDPNQTAIGVLRLSGIFTTTFKNISALSSPRPLYGSYIKNASGKNEIRINLNMTGSPRAAFTEGEFLTINGSVASGVVVTKGDFTLDEVFLGGDNGGISVPMTGKIGYSF